MLFIFDNQCSPRLANGLNILEQGNTLSPYQCEVKHIRELIPSNSDDVDVTKAAGDNEAILITYDRDFKELKQFGELYKQHNVGVVFFRSYKKVLRYWDLVLSFVNHWEELKRKVAETKKPFVFEITLKGISEKEI